MNQLQDISQEDVLNIFCDASIKTYPDGQVMGCAGAVGFRGGIKQPLVWNYTLIPPEATNNSSEIVALFLGIQMAHIHRHFFREINVFADSKICVYGIKEWYISWFKNMDSNGILFSSSGMPVANQEMFKRIIWYMVMNNVRCNIYHQKGHVTSTIKSLMQAKKVFEESNGVTLDKKQLSIICHGNDYVDIKTGDHLERVNPYKTLGFNFIDSKRSAFVPIVTQEDVIKYTEILKHGGTKDDS